VEVEMEAYIQRLEKEFSLIENGFKQEEKQALEDFRKLSQEYSGKLAYLAYQSTVYQVRMYGFFYLDIYQKKNKF
jgi:heat repeat domain protein